jgi:hypothetical protein
MKRVHSYTCTYHANKYTIHIHLHVHIHTHMHTHTHTHTHAHAYTHTHSHTHSHTQRFHIPLFEAYRDMTKATKAGVQKNQIMIFIRNERRSYHACNTSTVGNRYAILAGRISCAVSMIEDFHLRQMPRPAPGVCVSTMRAVCWAVRQDP